MNQGSWTKVDWHAIYSSTIYIATPVSMVLRRLHAIYLEAILEVN